MTSKPIDDLNQLQKDKEANQIRFEEDLEFVQSLANPLFVQELTFNGTLSSEPMLNYLNYLKYFHRPEYARFVRYPNGLKVLDLINKSENFRKMIETQETAQMLMDKFIQNWFSVSGRLNKLGPMVVQQQLPNTNITTTTNTTTHTTTAEITANNHDSNGLADTIQSEGFDLKVKST